jgi:hypothetical protein
MAPAAREGVLTGADPAANQIEKNNSVAPYLWRCRARRHPTGQTVTGDAGGG